MGDQIIRVVPRDPQDPRLPTCLLRQRVNDIRVAVVDLTGRKRLARRNYLVASLDLGRPRDAIGTMALLLAPAFSVRQAQVVEVIEAEAPATEPKPAEKPKDKPKAPAPAPAPGRGNG